VFPNDGSGYGTEPVQQAADKTHPALVHSLACYSQRESSTPNHCPIIGVPDAPILAVKPPLFGQLLPLPVEKFTKK
jgi:hypothetical protein